MTISRQGGKIFFECDGKRCANVCETDEITFTPAHEAMKAQGWQTRREAGDWVHICDDCIEAEQLGTDKTIRDLG